jgi:hypothetical protein
MAEYRYYRTLYEYHYSRHMIGCGKLVLRLPQCFSYDRYSHRARGLFRRSSNRPCDSPLAGVVGSSFVFLDSHREALVLQAQPDTSYSLVQEITVSMIAASVAALAPPPKSRRVRFEYDKEVTRATIASAAPLPVIPTHWCFCLEE